MRDMIDNTLINGRVTKVGYYGDTLPKLVITIPKCANGELSICDGERVNLLLSMNGETYQAGIRTTAKAKVFTICPDLLNSTGGDVRLTDLLLWHNIQQKDTVAINIDVDVGEALFCHLYPLLKHAPRSVGVVRDMSRY